MTRIDEISVKKLYDDFMQLDKVKMYFPDSYPKSRVCDREFMFNVINTLHPDVVTRIREHALEVRYIVNEDV